MTHSHPARTSSLLAVPPRAVLLPARGTHSNCLPRFIPVGAANSPCGIVPPQGFSLMVAV